MEFQQREGQASGCQHHFRLAQNTSTVDTNSIRHNRPSHANRTSAAAGKSRPFQRQLQCWCVRFDAMHHPSTLTACVTSSGRLPLTCALARTYAEAPHAAGSTQRRSAGTQRAHIRLFAKQAAISALCMGSSWHRCMIALACCSSSRACKAGLQQAEASGRWNAEGWQCRGRGHGAQRVGPGSHPFPFTPPLHAMQTLTLRAGLGDGERSPEQNKEAHEPLPLACAPA